MCIIFVLLVTFGYKTIVLGLYWRQPLYPAPEPKNYSYTPSLAQKPSKARNNNRRLAVSEVHESSESENDDLASCDTIALDVYSDGIFDGINFNFNKSTENPDCVIGSHSDISSTRQYMSHRNPANLLNLMNYERKFEFGSNRSRSLQQSMFRSTKKDPPQKSKENKVVKASGSIRDSFSF